MSDFQHVKKTTTNQMRKT